MPKASELMAAGIPAGAARQLGSAEPASITPTGSTQAGAAQLTSPVCTLATASSGGVILPSATGAPIYAIYNGSGASQTVYPASGESINGSSANTGFSVTSAKSAIFYPAGQKWIAVLSA